ncbi:tRNA 2-thiocytidine biosynthesis protein TtcA [Vallitalea pronyensis]|uniref:tRNA 2-thiocytidine biosynthesis protein TtcA n=1 Tax=Vallitalea pronyensis TaxID=1348613 RepID=A0A8J8MLF9_9FIRM|nr:tRNA 2-thiocytidine biosynthesis TtcA family protein [Vallitalea pronyensis]QUI23423.1 tRNA 2-thiocytidine biosynthesis protein TtcA [Vallitalea pronyensis]
MKLQQLLSYTRKAVDTYHMIDEGDKIAIGVSGGKDSLALMYALKGLQRFYPKKFEIEAITVALGFEAFDLSKVIDLCKELDIHYTVVHTDIAEIIFEERKEKNPCSLCSKMRKGALNEKAVELGCNKIALGHHKEDIVETMMMSLFFEGRFYTFSPVTYLDRMELYAIRPLMFVSEKDVIGFKNKYHLPVVKSPCPADGHTKREYMKNLLADLERDNPGLSQRLYRAIEGSQIKGWTTDTC